MGGLVIRQGDSARVLPFSSFLGHGGGAGRPPEPPAGLGGPPVGNELILAELKDSQAALATSPSMAEDSPARVDGTRSKDGGKRPGYGSSRSMRQPSRSSFEDSRSRLIRTCSYLVRSRSRLECARSKPANSRSSLPRFRSELTISRSQGAFPPSAAPNSLNVFRFLVKCLWRAKGAALPDSLFLGVSWVGQLC